MPKGKRGKIIEVLLHEFLAYVVNLAIAVFEIMGVGVIIAIAIVGAIIVLRAALTFLIHWEIKTEESQMEAKVDQYGKD